MGRAVHLTMNKENGVFCCTSDIDKLLGQFDINELTEKNDDPDCLSPIYKEDG